MANKMNFDKYHERWCDLRFWVIENRIFPTVRELQALWDIKSTSQVALVLAEMEKMGWLRRHRDGSKARGWILAQTEVMIPSDPPPLA